MSFSSSIFLFLFLPIVLFIYFVLMRTRKMKNIFLLLASLAFLAYADPKFAIIMIVSVIINYIFGLLIHHFNEKNSTKLSKLFLIIGIICNLSLLFVYKYLIVTLENINSIFKANIAIPKILLPIGLSFITLHILSYLIDVCKKKISAEKNPFDLGLYILLFPKMIAGPIIKYDSIKEQIHNRTENINKFAKGIKRFILGLGKKILIADTMAIVVNYIFSQTPDVATVSQALVWLGALAYALQIYFDLSGYSDMAIGLGKMFGFDFPENFDYPYISKSISEFWRRWHISLVGWFKDYIYIPLGGNQCSKKHLLFNLAVVWLLIGLWHGANWTFVIWGILYFVLIAFEKLIRFEESKKLTILKHIYTLFFIMLGWVIFRSENINYAFNYIVRMFTFKNIFDLKFAELLIENAFIFIFAIILSTPILRKLKDKVKILDNNIIKNTILVLILILSVAYISKGAYSPFIYFNF